MPLHESSVLVAPVHFTGSQTAASNKPWHPLMHSKPQYVTIGASTAAQRLSSSGSLLIAFAAASAAEASTKKHKRYRGGKKHKKLSLADITKELKARAKEQPKTPEFTGVIGEELVCRVIGGAERHGEVLVEVGVESLWCLDDDVDSDNVPSAVGDASIDTDASVKSLSIASSASDALAAPAAANPGVAGCTTTSDDDFDTVQSGCDPGEALHEETVASGDGVEVSEDKTDGEDADPVGEACEVGEMLICEIKRGSGTPEQPIVGDIVKVMRSPDAAGLADAVLCELMPRRTTLLRRHPTIPQKPQALCANLDLAVLVLSLAPNFSEGMVDRVLVSAHKQGFEAGIVLNKVDLCPEGSEERADVDARLQVYEKVGIRVLRTSTLTGEGIPELRDMLGGRTSILIGNSGVGKSHLLNALGDGQIEVRVGEISDRLKLGRHTTTTSTMHTLPGDGPAALLIDSPGARRFSIWDVEAPELKDHFVDFLPHAASCRYKNCNHLGEPGCAVADAIREGSISQERLDSYSRIHAELLQGREGVKVYNGMQMAGRRGE